MVTIKVGREANTKRLKLVSGQSTKVMGDTNSVPNSVSREHAEITVDDYDRIFVRNINPANQTMVNGMRVMTCEVTRADTLYLGSQGYQVNVGSIVGSFVKEKVDIRHLETIYVNYKQALLNEQKKNQRVNLWRTLSSTMTTLAIGSGVFLSQTEAFKSGESTNYAYPILYGCAIVIMLGITIWTFMHSNSAEERERLTQKFQDDYVCPKCEIFFGNMPYKQLYKRGKCYNCGVEFKKVM